MDMASFLEKFDLKELCLRLVQELNKTHEAKLMLDLMAPELRGQVIESLSSPKFAKTATKLVIDYGLDIGSFPNLQKIVDRNSSIFFIRRVFKDVNSADHMPLAKVEDLLQG